MTGKSKISVAGIGQQAVDQIYAAACCANSSGTKSSNKLLDKLYAVRKHIR